MPTEIKVQSNPELQRGAYSNNVKATASNEEVVLDFFAVFEQQGSHVSRIVLAPAQARRLAQLLGQVVDMVEKQQGRKIEAAPLEEQQRIGFQTQEA